MEGSTRIVIGVVLIVVIVGAIVALLLRTDVLRNPKPPEALMKQGETMIDEKTLTVVTKSLGEWESLGRKGEKYKNPETGAYSFVKPLICAACGKTIPTPEFPAIVAPVSAAPPAVRGGPPPGPRVSRAQMMEIMAKHDIKVKEIMRNYMCPVCGKNAYPAGMASGRPGPR